ncbi:TonB-dependent receptor [Nitrospirillum viridazoti]|uniref:Outer membrane receptor protein involved in Fe transport n=1 Tax=Nitrospirillum amazonense TaxID=28077 RepID=A0A560HIQ9_9PROT|nr:TonB-dependent receptor [Nitrospirillum amazonense]TWB46345.1 outer membrane receptor protein involved in Fe transport [Nitrospirillum amazonense]
MLFPTRFRASLLLAVTVPLFPALEQDASAQDASTIATKAAPETASPSEILVIASRVDMLDRASTASQGIITREEVELRPIYRASQLFESIPGLVVTVHSGEGKAQQYLIRGYNLDHGTDFASFVDEMPVNRPTNAHGQGYSDLNFLIPQVVAGLDYTKGPYYAGIGDFGSVASAHTRLLDEMPTKIISTVGTDGYQDVFVGGTYHLSGDQKLLGALDLSHYDGPWHPKQNFKKANALLRYSQGTANDGLSLTGMFYQSAGGLITDQPKRAVEAGLIGRFGTLDPTDHSESLRYSLSAHLDKPLGPGQLSLSFYGIQSSMQLVNNFTHYLDDPINGDQEAQHESRTTIGAAGSFTSLNSFGSVESETVVGVQGRYDTVFVTRQHTLNRTTILTYCNLRQNDGSVTAYATVNTYCNADRVHLLDLGPYVQNTMRWTPWLRTVAGVREELYHATDHSEVTGTGGEGDQLLFQPKGSLILGPLAKTELYFSAGRGFHSNDVRGVFGTVPAEGTSLAGGTTSMLVSTSGYEIGLRTNIIPNLSLQFAAFQQDFGSELIYNPDTGQDQAGAPSRRKGIEISGQYHPFKWLELNADLAFSKPRYHTRDLAAYGLNAPFIADAPNFIYSAGVLVSDLGPWTGSLIWRRLGTHHLNDGEDYPLDKGYSEFNLDIGYQLSERIKLGISVFNLLNSHDEAADYYYTSRLKGEPDEGVTGFQVHPLEPRSARFTVEVQI